MFLLTNGTSMSVRTQNCALCHEIASLILEISGAVPEFSEINFEIVPKIKKFVACAGQFGFDLIHSNACEKLM